MNARSYFIARTALGAPIETFETRERAIAWADDRGDLFPGWTLAFVTEVVTTRVRVIRRDRSHAEDARCA